MIYTKRIIGVDVGVKRIGLAQSDPTRTIASPVGTFSEADVLVRLKEQKQQIERIVVGWPISMLGHEGSATQMVEKFLVKLKKLIPDIPTELLDERFTSTLANQSIRAAVTSKKKRQNKGLTDTVAAAILLQSYLDKSNR
ncbi:MAG: Holliday junction resolvase RuvX [Bacteroidetes bacterium]|nr:Holliday junction resolvase RuvX [Bacteroidota bacterium]MCH8524318.1 Holliday junction resolvase RuvX [Balneolales bacterium]